MSPPPLDLIIICRPGLTKSIPGQRLRSPSTISKGESICPQNFGDDKKEIAGSDDCLQAMVRKSSSWSTPHEPHDDLHALFIFFPRYRAALTPPAASSPDTACLALETITRRLNALLVQPAASALAATATSPPASSQSLQTPLSLSLLSL